MPSRFLNTLSANLFGFGEPETDGERLFFRVLEAFVVAYAAWFCWEWAFYLPEIGVVVLPLGVARYVDISFLFGPAAYVNAALVMVLGLIGLSRGYFLESGGRSTENKNGSSLARLATPNPLTRGAPGWPATPLNTTRYAYLGMLLLVHLQYVARYSLGEISHGSTFIGVSMLALALADVFYVHPAERRRFALGTIYFILGCMYTTAGICKLVATGLSWPDGHHLWLWMSERQVDVLSQTGTFEPNALQRILLADYRLGTLVLGFGLAVELLGVALWRRRWRYVLIPALIVMHLGVALTLNIWFEAYLLELVLIGFPWPLLLDRLLNSPAILPHLHTSTRDASV